MKATPSGSKSSGKHALAQASDAAAPSSSAEEPVHCPYRQSSLLQQALTPDKMRIAFLLGAGCGTAVRVPDGDKTRALVPDIKGLTESVLAALRSSGTHKKPIGAVLERLSNGGTRDPTVEDVLSHVRTLSDIIGGGDIGGLNAVNLTSLDDEICAQITNVVKVRLPDVGAPHLQLAAWVFGITRVHAVEIFTTNYDVLIEQALERRRVPYFDGFVGSDRPFFDLASIEQGTLPSRWARVWKVHGSINWWRTPDGAFERHPESHAGARQMIHPSHVKFVQSRRMPYLAYLDRLRTFLAREPGVLVTCGYSFADEDVNDAILNGLSANPKSVCFAMAYRDLNSVPRGVACAKKQPNLNLMAADGAVLRTVERKWRATEIVEHPLHRIAACSGDFGDRTAAPHAQAKFLLGDFQSLGTLLAQDVADRSIAEGDAVAR